MPPRQQPYKRPPEIDAMRYDSCPICGEPGMTKKSRRSWWYCKACKNRNMNAVPSAEQQRAACKVFAPWIDESDD